LERRWGRGATRGGSGWNSWRGARILGEAGWKKKLSALCLVQCPPLLSVFIRGQLFIGQADGGDSLDQQISHGFLPFLLPTPMLQLSFSPAEESSEQQQPIDFDMEPG
jgi:hypothetical protein